MSTPCIQIPMLSNWKCLQLGPSRFPPVGGTQALVIIIILGVMGGYWYHMKIFGWVNTQQPRLLLLFLLLVCLFVEEAAAAPFSHFFRLYTHTHTHTHSHF